ncbi:MAG: 4-hydroxy-tetrahydrodipicolinate synthase [Candidatus Obscuribacterales bacterium]|nr:4-hydroxy-tetrahydrodipicolinate synthase [Candidatus Obscuribacterales bacterium]
MIKTEPLFGRLITAMVTPFKADGSAIDYDQLETLIEHLIKTGTTALVVAGTTGESPTLTEDEKKELLKRTISQVKGRVKVIMGTGSNITAKSIKATQEAEALGADGALVVAPYYNKPSQAGLLAHFGAIASASSLPVIVYNIPGRTGINIAVETIVELAQKHKNIAALKDSTGNVDQASDIADRAPEHFRIYSGDDNMTLPFLSVGACGVISVASHLAGPEISEMMESFFAGKLDRARELHYKLMPLFKGLFIAPNPTCVKYLLGRRGLINDSLRLPLVPLSAAQQATMDQLQ